MKKIALLFLTSALLAAAQDYTRGVGVYPGDPKEYAGPVMAIDQSYRNLALHRPAYHSTSYDYNLTAQLITDGIKDEGLPRWISVVTPDGPVPKNERDAVLDRHIGSAIALTGATPWIQIELLGGDEPFEVDRIDLLALARSNPQLPAGWTCRVLGSPDGAAWSPLGTASGGDRPSRVFTASIRFAAPSHDRFFRVEFDAPSVSYWRVSEVTPMNGGAPLPIGGPKQFTSAWMSAGGGEQWIYVDLGAPCTFDRVVLYWIRRAAEGAIQVSDDAAHWTTLRALPASSAPTDDIRLAQPAKGRYVRLLLTRAATPDGYILSEMEVYGRGGPAPKPQPSSPAGPDGRLNLTRGGWRLQRSSLVAATGQMLSQPGFPDRDWMIATVPGTVLTSYLNDGAVPDPYFGDNQYMISDSFFWSDFWYRTEFTAPPAAGRHVWLNFDGIDWKAHVYLNGRNIGRIEGAFMRGRFDVTGIVHPGAVNALAVRIEKNANPGKVQDKAISFRGNGGALGADNPTFHATIGWDWMPTIRGRDTGIQSAVYLTESGPVTIEHPLVTTQLALPDTSRADVTIEATLHNRDDRPVSGTLLGSFGNVRFQMPITLGPAAATTVRLGPATTPALRIAKPKLWWPNGYGDPNLYPVELRFETAAGVSDTKSFEAGIREFTYSEAGNALRIWINGRRFIPRGGNWGFPEAMLKYGAREFDVAVRYHRDEHFNMIRNWVGMTGSDAFYNACDRYGIVVWQDFWLANPADGPNPDDPTLFLRNARDSILRIRNHPSIGLYCGRNEGMPPPIIDAGLRALTAGLDPGSHYIPSSADDNTHGTGTYVVTGHGPYRNLWPRQYFEDPPKKLHSEMGSPNFVTLDSLRLMMPESGMWPQGAMWSLHDAWRHSPIVEGYGKADDLEQWLWLAQFQDYQAYRGMFEGQSKYRMGLLIWMSHSAWPDLLWQTYDYYFNPDAGYFGAKKGAEPLHIQWNAADDNVEVVNYSAGTVRGLTARARIYNMDGSLRWEKSAQLASVEDSTQTPIHLESPSGLSPVHFIELTLSRGKEVVSDNFYWRGATPNDYQAIRDLPKIKIAARTRVERHGDRWFLATKLENISKAPALMVRLTVVREQSGDRILPALYSDNYVSLMPGEKREIHTEIQNADTRGETPRMVVDGFNVGEIVYR
jgi:Glycosyl hydrolase 2 galactose-binding domain-like/Exo-beta-D-glucosaminidase Ig-fold domain/NedA-like, galactose-binding domain/Glycosyl hydrolases family 2